MSCCGRDDISVCLEGGAGRTLDWYLNDHELQRWTLDAGRRGEE